MSGIEMGLDSYNADKEDDRWSRISDEKVCIVDDLYNINFRRDQSIKNLEKQVKKLNNELSLMRTDLAKWFGYLRKPNEQLENDVAEPPNNTDCEIFIKPSIKTMGNVLNEPVSGINGENGDVVTLKLGIDSIGERLENAIADYERILGQKGQVVDSMKNKLQAFEAIVAEEAEKIIQLREQITNNELKMSVWDRNFEAKEEEVKNLKYLLKLADVKLEERLEQIKQMDEQLTKLIIEVKANEVKQTEDVDAVAENMKTAVSSSIDIRDKIVHGSRKIFETDQPVTQVIATSEGRKGSVTGLTVHGDELFIVRFESKGLIEVYNATNFTFKRNIKVKEPEEVGYYGLTSCDTNNCLYVSCWYFAGVGYIVRVELELTGDNEVVEWKVEVRGNYGYLPLGLSVNSEHNLMVACWRQSHALIEYTTHGELVREILLQDDVKWPRHAIQLNNSQFLVSHGSGHCDSLHRVCVVDANNGHVLLSYGNKPGSESGQLNEPRHLAVDRNGFIFVADKDNSRIVVLDSTLKWSRDLQIDGGSGVKQPFSLYLDKKRNLLFVGELNRDDGNDSRVVVVTV